MAAPFVVVRTVTIKEGKLEHFKQFLREFFKVVEANEPRLLAINAYANEEGTEATFVQVYADAASMKDHEKVHEHTERARRHFLEATTRIEVYGKPTDDVLEKAKQLAETGVAVTVKPEHLGGFTRDRGETHG
jgi:quinol monooxygenase YgiN